MPRTRKTTFLYYLPAARLPETTVYVSFDDDRLANLEAEQLSLRRMSTAQTT